MNYRLIYSTTTENELRVDDCFIEAGVIDLKGIKTTPLWLKINPNTGLLYGTPRVTDAPKDEMITVVVTDENGLRTMARMPLKVFGVSHKPVITGIPQVDCIDPNSPYSTKITITDTDLLRTNPEEVITLKLLDYLKLPLTGMSINPTSFKGTGSSNKFDATITKTGNLQRDLDGKVTIRVVVQDAFANTDTLVFRLNLSEQTDFVAKVKVTNTKGSTQDLYFGTSSVSGTSTGDGNDKDYIGKLDADLCEWELPPVPFEDVFDARWTITNRNGVLRNIFPTSRPDGINNYIYKGQFQAGGVMGGSSPLYPVTISWNPAEVPSRTDNVKNPSGSSWFLKDRFSDGNMFIFNMNDPDKNHYTSVVQYTLVGGIANVTIIDDAIYQFVIMHDWKTSVQDLGDNASSTRIISVSPNPISDNNEIKFELLQSSPIKLQVVDMLGSVIATITNEQLSSGQYSIVWDGKDASGMKLTSGEYMIRLVAGNATSIYPVVVVK